MIRLKKFFAVAVAGVMLLVTLAFGTLTENGLFAFADDEVDIWDGTSDVSWYDVEETELYLSTPEELAGLAEKVNAGYTMEGQTFYLTNDIYLNDISDFDNWSEIAPARNWTTIGDSEDTAFCGTFDG
ncbi:MAG: hypothetical protein LIO74_06970 [Ruminococcus sp.]|nr:hypothetical protein [Ruminococcus sp.]